MKKIIIINYILTETRPPWNKDKKKIKTIIQSDIKRLIPSLHKCC